MRIVHVLSTASEKKLSPSSEGGEETLRVWVSKGRETDGGAGGRVVRDRYLRGDSIEIFDGNRDGAYGEGLDRRGGRRGRTETEKKLPVDLSSSASATLVRDSPDGDMRGSRGGTLPRRGIDAPRRPPGCEVGAHRRAWGGGDRLLACPAEERWRTRMDARACALRWWTWRAADWQDWRRRRQKHPWIA